MLICVCKEHPLGRLGSAICGRGHSIRVCIEPDCLDLEHQLPHTSVWQPGRCLKISRRPVAA